MTMADKEEHWTMDRRVPVALIVTILIQAAGVIWFARGISSDVEAIKVRQDRQDALIEAMRTTAGVQAVQLGRIEENTRATQAAVERLLRQVEDDR
jgi:Tfp pilus assembly protein PilO